MRDPSVTRSLIAVRTFPGVLSRFANTRHPRPFAADRARIVDCLLLLRRRPRLEDVEGDLPGAVG
jgi:hypothetical protein